MKKVWEELWEEKWLKLNARLDRDWRVVRWEGSRVTITWDFSMPDDLKTRYVDALEKKGPNSQ